LEELKKLKEEYNDCERCPLLVKNRNNVVFGTGDSSRVLIIGEAPGMQEDLRNEPFVGRSGEVLNSLLADIGLSRSDVYITNTILCRPPDNRNPSSEELRNCKSRLDRHVEILDPEVIITLGNFATKYILGTSKGITTIHGRVFDIGGRKVVPMYHPAVLLYSGNNPDKRKELLNDFMTVKTLLGGTDLRSFL